MVKVNDIVRFLNDVGGGKVTKIEGNTAYVEDSDGFERPVPTRELVVVNATACKPSTYERPVKVKSKLVEPDKPSAPKPQLVQAEEPVIETKGGDVLNIVLAYEARELKHLSTTTFYATLVNDSNYFLYATYMSRGDDDTEWTTRWAGVVEPNFQLELEEFGHDDLNSLTHVAVQYVAFKQQRGFKLKNPALVEQRLDVTKFYKLHSFHDNEYFDVPVIALTITRNDLPARQLTIDSSELERAMRGKRAADERPKAQPVKRHQHRDPNSGNIVIDLHISELLDDTTGMNHTDMLNYQLSKFREAMDENINRPGQRIVFIHGKGEGVLRHALLQDLKRHYPHCLAQDASFREYGFGATQVTIHK